MSLRDYAPGGRYFNHPPPLDHTAPPTPHVHAQPPPPAVHEHVYAQDEEEEAAYIEQAKAASEAAISDMLRRGE